MNTPLYDAIKGYSDSRPVPFHMPGHKLGNGLPKELTGNIARLDLTEIPGTDNLHYPESAIKEAQLLAAKAFGAEETFFLVNGSTCGIHAMILAVCSPGDKLIVSRDCHRAVINGMILAGVTPVYIKPGFSRNFGISTAVTPEDVESALTEHPDAVGVIITRPNYYGICSDIKRISEIVHSFNRVLLVDEAHGAHFRFHENLPECAMDGGADICVQSAHKTLLAFTQGAYLHVKSSRINKERLKFYLSMLQTTSPSYIIMASLDIARAVMECRGAGLIGKILCSIEKFKQEISRGNLPVEMLIPGIQGCESVDFTRMVISVRNLGITGYEAERFLRERYNIQVEMSDFYNIVCIASVGDKKVYYDRLMEALVDITRGLKDSVPLDDIYVNELKIPYQKLTPCQAAERKSVRVKLKDSAGKISAATITPYPPGIPVVCPGEILLEEVVEYIYNIIDCGGTVNGLDENFEVNVID